MKKAINIIIAALVVVAMASLIMNISNGPLPIIIVHAIWAALCILVLYYNFLGYKKPHGNLLRYTFLIFGSTMIINQFILGNTDLSAWCLITAGIITIYMSGRLNKIEKNKILAIVVLVLHAVFAVVCIFNIDISFAADQSAPSIQAEMSIIHIIEFCTGLFLWLALALAYTSRYAAHKEAGLEDKPKA